MNFNLLIGNEILELWDNYKDIYFCKDCPVVPENVQDLELLFIGLNPSVRKNDPHLCNYETDRHLVTYGVLNADDNYFSKFIKIAERTGFADNWAHFDLLFVKGNQKFVSSVIKDKSNNGDSFIWHQLQLSKKILEKLNPKIIVISNVLAADLTGKNRIEKNGKIYGEWMNLKFENLSDNITWNGIPVIFSKQPNRFFKNIELDELVSQINNIRV